MPNLTMVSLGFAQLLVSVCSTFAKNLTKTRQNSLSLEGNYRLKNIPITLRFHVIKLVSEHLK